MADPYREGSEGSSNEETCTEQELQALQTLLKLKKKERRELTRLQEDTDTWHDRANKLNKTLELLNEQLQALRMESTREQEWVSKLARPETSKEN